MTNYSKWDQYIATLSLSDDEEDSEGHSSASVAEADTRGNERGSKKYGWGKPLDSKGQVDRTGELTVGNAKGNSLSTNKAPQKTFQINEWKWEQSEDQVQVTLDISKAMKRCISDITNQLDFHQDMVRTEMQENALVVRCYDQQNTWELVFALSKLPGIDPQKSSFTLLHDPGVEKTSGSYQRVVMNLTKSQKGRTWESCGEQRTISNEKVKLPVVTVKQYSWSDAEQHVTVYLKIPGVHLVDESCIQVRYRELSFDVACEVGGKQYCFAVTELPMEIQVDKCSHSVKNDEVRIKLKKWARCSWFKLQVHR